MSNKIRMRKILTLAISCAILAIFCGFTQEPPGIAPPAGGAPAGGVSQGVMPAGGITPAGVAAPAGGATGGALPPPGAQGAPPPSGITSVPKGTEIRNLAPGTTWMVEKTTSLAGLTIAEGATLKAPEGYNLTMVVDTVGTAIRPGTYKGNIVLAITEKINITSQTGSGMPPGAPPAGMAPPGGAPPADTAMARAPGTGMPPADVSPGAAPPGAGAPGGAPSAGATPPPGETAGNVPAAGGAPVGAPPAAGAPGGAPPAGGMPGAGSMPAESSDPFRAALYIENGKFISEKSVTALVAGGRVSDPNANNIKVTSDEGRFNGIIVSGGSRTPYNIINPVISLNGNGGNDASGLGSGIMTAGRAEVTIRNARIINTGANRSALFVRNEGIIHVNNSYIEVNNGPPAAEGAISADGMMMPGPWLLGITGNVRAVNIIESGTAYFNNTHIKSQGWGALSTDGPVKIRLYASKCLIETVESGYGAYAIGDCLDFFSECTFNVADYGLILCDNANATFTDGTVVNSKKIGVMMHTGTGGGKLIIDKGSVFNTKSAVIQIKGRGTEIIADNAQLNSESGVILQSMANDDPFFTSGQGTAMGTRGFSRDVNATFRNMTLKGDMINSWTDSSALNAVFENTTITGAITTGTVKQPTGPGGEKLSLQSPELYYLIGQVTNTYCAMFDDPYGVSVRLDKNSAWIVDKTSYITSLTIDRGAVVKAPEGYILEMTVDGRTVKVRPGTYRGDIILSVSKDI